MHVCLRAIIFCCNQYARMFTCQFKFLFCAAAYTLYLCMNAKPGLSQDDTADGECSDARNIWK
jgi:hypothetical protein